MKTNGKLLCNTSQLTSFAMRRPPESSHQLPQVKCKGDGLCYREHYSPPVGKDIFHTNDDDRKQGEQCQEQERICCWRMPEKSWELICPVCKAIEGQANVHYYRVIVYV